MPSMDGCTPPLRAGRPPVARAGSSRASALCARRAAIEPLVAGHGFRAALQSCRAHARSTPALPCSSKNGRSGPPSPIAWDSRSLPRLASIQRSSSRARSAGCEAAPKPRPRARPPTAPTTAILASTSMNPSNRSAGGPALPEPPARVSPRVDATTLFAKAASVREVRTLGTSLKSCARAASCGAGSAASREGRRLRVVHARARAQVGPDAAGASPALLHAASLVVLVRRQVTSAIQLRLRCVLRHAPRPLAGGARRRGSGVGGSPTAP